MTAKKTERAKAPRHQEKKALIPPDPKRDWWLGEYVVEEDVARMPKGAIVVAANILSINGVNPTSPFQRRPSLVTNGSAIFVSVLAFAEDVANLIDRRIVVVHKPAEPGLGPFRVIGQVRSEFRARVKYAHDFRLIPFLWQERGWRLLAFDGGEISETNESTTRSEDK